MITPSYSPTATERILPRLTIDFTTASLDARITFTRAGNTATRVNSSGIVEVVNADTARFDYDPVNLTCRGILIEGPSTNLSSYSSEFDNAVWGRSNLQAFGSGSVVDAVTSPDGTQTADFIAENTATSGHQLFRTYSGTTNTDTYVVSVFAKASTRSQIELRLFESPTFTRFVNCQFDLSAGTAGTASNNGGASGATATITDFGNGWYRCTLSGTLGGTDTALQTRFHICSGGNVSYTGDGSSGIYIWGAQFEKAAYPSSYIPTTTATVTRNADVAVMTSTNFSGWWQATTGGVLVRARPYTVSGNRPWLQFDDNTTSNIIALRGNSTNPELYVKATTDQAQIDAGTIAANTIYNLAGAWNTNDCAVAINGNTAITDTSATVPTVTQTRIGSDGTDYFGGHIQVIRYWPQRITNLEVQAISK